MLPTAGARVSILVSSTNCLASAGVVSPLRRSRAVSWISEPLPMSPISPSTRISGRNVSTAALTCEKPKVLEGAIDRIVRHQKPELLMQPHDQIARPPAHHAMDRRDWAVLYDAGEKGLMNSVVLGRHPRRVNIDETVRSLLVEPDHPVPQRLTIHAANLRRLFPRGPLEHGRNR